MRLNSKLEYNPKRVISIVSPSRSGSTVFKYALCLHPELSSLAGEEEPYYKIAHNGFPWDQSDEFHAVRNPEVVKLLISNELHNHESEYNRIFLQANELEEPPFIQPIKCRLTDTLVLKTPQNSYRRGVMEQLYPDSEVIYISLKRNQFATINSMIDAWQSSEFTARRTPMGWWKLDMPHNWSWDVTLIEKCINQYRQALDHIEYDYPDAWSFNFEAFQENWQSVCFKIWDILGLKRIDLGYQNLPHLSTTDNPKPNRWLEKRPWLQEILI